jgi:ADP-ribosylglycohydrolase family protein
MLGAIVGDIIGSAYEFKNTKRKEFHLFTPKSKFTDDTVMTLAVARWLCDDKEHCKETLVQRMQELGRRYPTAGYAGSFMRWLYNLEPQPYNSYGNGSAMRVSPVAFYAHSLQEALGLAKISAEVTHNHSEGIKGAQAIASSIYLARHGATKREIKSYVEENFHYDLSQQLDDIRPIYSYDMSCQHTVPQALLAFLEGANFEEVIRSAVSIGGDSDTIAAMAGGIAQAFYVIPKKLSSYCYALLTPELRGVLNDFEDLLGCREADPFNIERFIEAQNTSNTYRQALAEMQQGHKQTHWIWFIFPQLKGFGHSAYSQYYGLADTDEARTYLAHPLLNERLRTITKAVLLHGNMDVKRVMGSSIDAVKLKSSMTLFDVVCPNDIFEEVLKTFYGGDRDSLTLNKIGL